MTHHLLTHLLLAAEATPSSIPSYNADGSPLGSPGFTGFVVTMFLGLMIILLGLDLTRRARRMRYRNDYALAREAELKAQETAEQKSLNQPENAEEGVAEHIRRAH